MNRLEVIYCYPYKDETALTLGIFFKFFFKTTIIAKKILSDSSLKTFFKCDKVKNHHERPSERLLTSILCITWG